MRPYRARLGRLLTPLALAAALTCGAASGLLGTCGPFTDTANDAFCPFVLEIFYLGITTGTSPTTFDPTSDVSRLQAAAFLSRTVDGVLSRGSRRAALNQFWTTKGAALGLTTVGGDPHLVRSDGADLWVANEFGGTVSRVRGSDGRLLETWTGARGAYGVLVAMGRVFVSGDTNPGNLYRLDPTQTPGSVTTVASGLGGSSRGIAFDGSRIWIANNFGASVSIITPGTTIPWTVTTITSFDGPEGILYDSSNIWVVEVGGSIRRVDAAGAVLQTVTVGSLPGFPAFDGTNIWVPNQGSNTVSVIRAASGAVLQTLSSNGLNGPLSAAFDGQRVLVTNVLGDSVSLWKAADLTPIGFSWIGSNPWGACSDGINFWITLFSANQLARF